MNESISFIIEYLQMNGFIVYPTEIYCGIDNVPHYPYRFVDAAAYKEGNFYAFEFKSSGDPLCSERVFKQIENYKVSFDYVILVAEIPRKGRTGFTLNLKGKKIYDILRLGAGICILSINSSTKKYVVKEIVKPKKQKPNLKNKRFIEKQFTSILGFNPCQQKLDYLI
jgi:hypothetical protein